MKKILLLSLVVCMVLSCKSTHDFKFEKLTYHTSACFGRCPTYHMEISADKKIRLHSETAFHKRDASPDASAVGYFTGTVNDTTFNKLLLQLRTVGLDTVKFGGPDCCDGPVKTIIIYYNGKRKYLHAMFPPDHALPLIATLNGIYSTSKFVKSAQPFEIERDSIPRAAFTSSPKHQE